MLQLIIYLDKNVFFFEWKMWTVTSFITRLLLHSWMKWGPFGTNIIMWQLEWCAWFWKKLSLSKNLVEIEKWGSKSMFSLSIYTGYVSSAGRRAWRPAGRPSGRQGVVWAVQQAMSPYSSLRVPGKTQNVPPACSTTAALRYVLLSKMHPQAKIDLNFIPIQVIQLEQSRQVYVRRAKDISASATSSSA